MYCDKHQSCATARLYLLLLALTIFLSACQDDLPEVPAKEEFTKEKLEKLGDILRPGLLTQFQFLPEMTPYDTSVYWYVQRLYDQATYTMRLDKQSPPDNRWTPGREWKVFIIKDDELRHSFALPGGDLFITTGLLKSFKKEYELFYALSFEAMLMKEGHLLNILIREYNSLTINNIIEGKQSSSDITADILTQEFSMLSYAPETVKQVDMQTSESICNTSLFDPTGIGPFLLNQEYKDALWLQTRPSYDGRVSVLATLRDSTCGDLKGTGNYEKYVLEMLD